MGVTEADYGEACPTFSDYHNSSHMELSAAVPLIAHPPPFAVSFGWHVGHLFHKNPSIWSCYHLLWALLSMFVVYSCLSLVFFFFSPTVFCPHNLQSGFPLYVSHYQHLSTYFQAILSEFHLLLMASIPIFHFLIERTDLFSLLKYIY